MKYSLEESIKEKRENSKEKVFSIFLNMVIVKNFIY